jgi:hypothetical protein
MGTFICSKCDQQLSLEQAYAHAKICTGNAQQTYDIIAQWRKEYEDATPEEKKKLRKNRIKHLLKVKERLNPH